MVERYTYLAYGQPTFHNPDGTLAASQTSSALSNPYLFTGRRIDSETGLQYSRARYYAFQSREIYRERPNRVQGRRQSVRVCR